MQISPIHVAGVVLTGGLVTGSYFFYQSVAPSKLEDYLKKLNVDLLTKGWETKEAKYKETEDVNDLIPTIKKGEASKPIENFARDLQNWCQKKKDKYFLDDTDLTYRRFSLWCTTTKKIKDVLDGRNLKKLTPEQQEAKVAVYNLIVDGEKFIGSPKAPKAAEENSNIAVKDLTAWCDNEKNNEYKYEGFGNLKKIIEWCYA